MLTSLLANATIIDSIILFFTAIAVSAVGNIAGVGGGVLLVPFFIFYMGLNPVAAGGLSLITILASTIGGSYMNFKEGAVDKKLYYYIVVFAVIGVLIGSFANRFIQPFIFEVVFGVIIVCLGIIAVYLTHKQLPASKATDDKEKTEITRKRTTGAVSSIAGFLSGFLGIGIGGIMGVFLTAAERIPPRIAFSTIIAVMIVTSAIGAVAHFYGGGISSEVLLYAIPLAPGAIAGGAIGAVLARRSSSRKLRFFQAYLTISFGVLELLLTLVL